MTHTAPNRQLRWFRAVSAVLCMSVAQIAPVWAGETDCNRNGIPDHQDLPRISWPTAEILPVDNFDDHFVTDFEVGDMNGDGTIDVVAALGGDFEPRTRLISLVLNEGGARFSAPIMYTASQPISDVVLGHLDRNDTLDVVVARTVGFDRFLNRGEGILEQFPSNLFVVTPFHILVADVSGDGVGDFVFDADFTVFLNNGDGQTSFNRKLRPATRPGIRAADFDGDGLADILASNYERRSLVFFLGTGSTLLQETAELRFQHQVADFAVADFDGDGDPDAIAYFDEIYPLALILNRGHPNYEVVDVSVAPFTLYRSLDVADVDSDSRPDIILNHSADLQVLLNRGNGAFVQTGTGLESVRTRAADMNGDGAQDLITLQFHSTGSQPLVLALAEVESGNSLDCNFNRVPDECELGVDCNENGSPDECDLDSDGDGTVDGCDECPGAPDTDLDRDGVLDCFDECPEDPAKVAIGSCGCRLPDVDPDADGIASCLDRCPDDSDSTQQDTDGDLQGDACDDCPADPLKTSARFCGCGMPDSHSDLDGFPDCIDGCPLDRNKQDPAVCGCGVAERDLADVDGDGRPGCVDNCPFTANSNQADHDRDRFGDVCDRGPDQACPGDCDRDLRVDTADVQMAARVIFASTGVGRCSAQILDHDSSGSVRANDIVAMIGSEWRCRPLPTPLTPTPTPTPLVDGEFQVSTSGPDPVGGFAACSFSADSAVVAWGRRVVKDELMVQRINPTAAIGPLAAFENETSLSAMACQQDGSSVAVWRDGDDLRMRRLGVNGLPVGPTIEVHEPRQLRQWQPSVACPTQDRCIVTWTGETHPSDSDPDVFARIFDSLLDPVGPTFRIGVSQVERRRESKVRALPGGDVVVAWAGDGVRFRLFDEAGTPLGAETTASSTSNSGHQSPEVAVQSNGDFLIAWVERDRQRISVRPFASDGSPRGPEIHVVTFTEAQRVELAPVGESGYLLAWMSRVGDEVSLYMHTLDSGGAAMGEPVEVADHFVSGETHFLAEGVDGRAFLMWRHNIGVHAVSLP